MMKKLADTLKKYEQKFVLSIGHNFFLLLSLVVGLMGIVALVLIFIGIIPVPNIAGIYETIAKPRNPSQHIAENVKIGNEEVKSLLTKEKSGAYSIKILTDSLISLFPQNQYLWNDTVLVSVNSLGVQSRSLVRGVQFYLVEIFKEFSKLSDEEKIAQLNKLIKEISAVSGTARKDVLISFYNRLHQTPELRKEEMKESISQELTEHVAKEERPIIRSVYADSLEHYKKILSKYFPQPDYIWKTHNDTIVRQNQFGMKDVIIKHYEGLDRYIDTLIVYLKYDTLTTLQELNRLVVMIGSTELKDRGLVLVNFVREHHPDYVAYQKALKEVKSIFESGSQQYIDSQMGNLLLSNKGGLKLITFFLQRIRGILENVPRDKRKEVFDLCVSDWKVRSSVGFVDDDKVNAKIYLIRTLCTPPCVWDFSENDIRRYVIPNASMKAVLVKIADDDRIYKYLDEEHRLEFFDRLYKLLKETDPEKRTEAIQIYYTLWRDKLDNEVAQSEMARRRYHKRLAEVQSRASKIEASIHALNRAKSSLVKFSKNVLMISLVLIIALSLFLVIYAIEQNTRSMRRLITVIEELNSNTLSAQSGKVDNTKEEQNKS